MYTSNIPTIQHVTKDLFGSGIELVFCTLCLPYKATKRMRPEILKYRVTTDVT